MLKLTPFQVLNYDKWMRSVRCALASRGIYESTFARDIGIDPTSLSKYFSGKITPPLTFYFVVEDYLNKHVYFKFF